MSNYKYKDFISAINSHFSSNSFISLVEDIDIKNYDGYFFVIASGDISKNIEKYGLLKHKIFLLGVSSHSMFEYLDKYNLVGAVDSFQMAQWAANCPRIEGPYGLKCLLNSTNAVQCSVYKDISDNYCVFNDINKSRSLIEMTCDYITAHKKLLI